MPPLLSVEGLKTHYLTAEGVVRAVDGVSFEIHEKRCLGIVGESGSGKSQTALSIMGLIPHPPGRIVAGRILYHEEEAAPIDLTAIDPKGTTYRGVRGNKIAMIFQEPMSSLSPVYTIGQQICEAIREHGNVDRRTAHARAVELLQTVGIPAPEQRVDEYPHQLSGGMRQRAMIAMGISCNPRLLIADEPTTALDVTVQLQILRLLAQLRERYAMGLLLITHDLGVIAEIADDVAVMYLGKIVERASTREILRNPHHPYTRGLLRSIPSLRAKGETLEPIRGTVPSPDKVPIGCPFVNRCPRAMEKCAAAPPPVLVAPGHEASCWLYAQE